MELSISSIGVEGVLTPGASMSSVGVEGVFLSLLLFFIILFIDFFCNCLSCIHSWDRLSHINYSIFLHKEWEGWKLKTKTAKCAYKQQERWRWTYCEKVPCSIQFWIQTCPSHNGGQQPHFAKIFSQKHVCHSRGGVLLVRREVTTWQCQPTCNAMRPTWKNMRPL